MFARRPRAVAPAPVAEASPLLTFITGEFAPALAALWPAPHVEILTAPAQRRHLVCLALALDVPAGKALAGDLLAGSLKRGLRQVSPGGPAGLERALGRLGERGWTRDDYRVLLRLLAERRAAKILRHAEVITVEQVRAVATLPDALLDAGAGGLPLTAHAAAILAECFDALSRRDGESTANERARRWLQTANSSPFDLAAEDTDPELPPPPFPGTSRLSPLASKAAVADAAKRYNNCLRSSIASCANGNSAIYEWLGPPSAVLSIYPDRLFGWALDECRLAANEPVPEPHRSQIIEALRGMGVHVGRSTWQVCDALREAREETFRLVPVETQIRELFGDYS